VPNKLEWVEPALAFRLLDGRPVFHVYKNDTDTEMLRYHYTLSASSEDEESREFLFDVRDLEAKFSWGGEHPELPQDPRWDIATHMCIVQRAYAAGMLNVPE